MHKVLETPPATNIVVSGRLHTYICKVASHDKLMVWVA